MKKILLMFVSFLAMTTTAMAEDLVIKDFVLTATEGEQFDVDGYFKAAVLTYTVEGIEDHTTSGATIYYTVVPTEEGDSIHGDIDLDTWGNSRNINIKGLAYTTEYKLIIDSISVDEFNYDTFETDHLYTITTGLPEAVTFTTSGKPFIIKDFVLTATEGEEFDEDDYFKAAVLTYTVEGIEEHAGACATAYYTVTPKDEGDAISDNIDLDTWGDSRNINIKGLAYSTEYSLKIDSVSVDELNMETFETDHLYTITSGLPKAVTFTTSGEPTGIADTKAVATKPEGKFIENQKVVIRKNNKKYYVNGIAK